MFKSTIKSLQAYQKMTMIKTKKKWKNLKISWNKDWNHKEWASLVLVNIIAMKHQRSQKVKKSNNRKRISS